ncbi:MAG: hypothetical protein HYT99_07455 [Candidatus Tectomicrobia bacterium]|nr:hypothetical protein [Candidatus Tectomicrobia bacterium]
MWWSITATGRALETKGPSSFPRRLEDLECDDITFAGLGVGAMWSQDAYDRIINAWEIPAGLCAFGGGGEPGLREEKAGEQDVAIWLKDSHRSNIERNLADGGEIHLGELVIESLPAAVPAGESNAADGQGQGVTPAKVTYTVEGSQAGNVLVYTDDYQPSAGDTYVERALQELGISYTGYYSNPSGFCSALQGGGPWDMVLVSHNNYFQLGQCWTELEAWYVVADPGRGAFGRRGQSQQRLPVGRQPPGVQLGAPGAGPDGRLERLLRRWRPCRMERRHQACGRLYTGAAVRAGREAHRWRRAGDS